MKTRLRVGSLFAGIGGICKAFDNAGSELIWANEIDKNACITYRANFDHKLYEDDIHNLTKKENICDIEKVDIITSGFPCQAFSIAGYQKGFDDPRGNLFFETAKIIDSIRPKVFLLENVRNLVGHDEGRTFEVIKDIIINKLNYSFIPFIINSMDYGNIPQNRERIYIVGFKDEGKYDNFNGKIGYYNIKEEEDYRKMVNNRSKTGIKTLDFRIPMPINLDKSIRDMIDKNKQDNYYYYGEDSRYYEKLSGSIISKDSIYQWRRTYVRENKSNVCPTLTANMGTGGHNVPIIKDDYGIRKLTPRECFRFQGFDDNFILPDIARGHLYKQAGNSVTITVMNRIAEEIIKSLGVEQYVFNLAR